MSIDSIMGVPGQLTQLLASPILRAPSQLFATASTSVGTLSNTQIATMLGTAADISATTNSSTLVDVVSQINGRGLLLFGAQYTPSGASGGFVEVTIDGVVVLSAGALNPGLLRCFAGAVCAIDTTNQRCEVALQAIPYYTSLRVRHRSDGAGAIGTAFKYQPHN